MTDEGSIVWRMEEPRRLRTAIFTCIEMLIGLGMRAAVDAYGRNKD